MYASSVGESWIPSSLARALAWFTPAAGVDGISGGRLPLLLLELLLLLVLLKLTLPTVVTN